METLLRLGSYRLLIHHDRPLIPLVIYVKEPVLCSENVVSPYPYPSCHPFVAIESEVEAE